MSSGELTEYKPSRDRKRSYNTCNPKCPECGGGTRITLSKVANLDPKSTKQWGDLEHVGIKYYKCGDCGSRCSAREVLSSDFEYLLGRHRELTKIEKSTVTLSVHECNHILALLVNDWGGKTQDSKLYAARKERIQAKLIHHKENK